jgi:hypothetical protein
VKRFALLIAAAGAVASISAFTLAGGASGASSLPTLNISETGTTGISVSSPVANNAISGAVNIVSTATGAGPHGASYGLVLLNPNETPAAAAAAGFAAVQAAHGNLNALTATGDSLIVSADAPGTVQAVLPVGNYVALNLTGNGRAPNQPFAVTQSASPAALPAAAATLTAIEFGFKGPKVLKTGTTVRAVNGGFLFHMNDLTGVRSKAAGKSLIAALLAGKGRKALRPFLNGTFIDLMNPASPGATQQQVLKAKPGYYVEACFENTQDGREHTQLGMERLVKVTK